jgi:protein HOOK3
VEDNLKVGTKDTQAGMLAKDQELRIQKQEDLIASQEARLADYQRTSENMQRSAERCRKAEDRAQALQDEVDMIKAERDNLARKANALDKYKQKALAAQDLEKDYNLLRGEHEELRNHVKDSDEWKKKVAGLEGMVAEYRKILPRLESEHHELQMMKKTLEYDTTSLAQKLENADAQHVRDLETIADLKEKSMHSRLSMDFGNLEAELEGTQKKENLMYILLVFKLAGLTVSLQEPWSTKPCFRCVGQD